MHIAYLSIESPLETDRGGGIAAYLRAIIPGLVQSGHTVTVISHAAETGIHYAHNKALKVVHIRLPAMHWYLNKLSPLSKTIALPWRQLEWSFKFFQVAQQIFRNRPLDILESAETGSLFLSRGSLVPVVIRLHGSDYLFKKYTGEPITPSVRLSHQLDRLSLKKAQQITAPSRAQAEEINPIIPNKVEIVPNPIAPATLSACSANQGADGRPEWPTILYAGRLAPIKGVGSLLDAAKVVQKITPQSCFVLAGEWQMSDTPQDWRLEKVKGINQNGVIWLGHVPWPQLVDLYRRAAIFVMPSYYETFGISAIEAMAFGLPVVASNTGGLPEVVEDGVTGLLVPPGDAAALAEAIVRLLRDPQLRQRMGQAGRERVLANFTAEKVAEQTLTVYQKVMQQTQ